MLLASVLSSSGKCVHAVDSEAEFSEVTGYMLHDRVSIPDKGTFLVIHHVRTASGAHDP